jgi:CheY-like chemotaxis protein
MQPIFARSAADFSGLDGCFGTFSDDGTSVAEEILSQRILCQSQRRAGRSSVLLLVGVLMSGGSVLIVESDRATVRQLTDLLSALPLEVSVARTREEAMELTLRNSFQLCLVSHGLVDGSGLDFFQSTLRKRGRPTGVLLSRHADLRVVLQALDAGFSHVISQPVESQFLFPILVRLFPECGCVDQSNDASCERTGLMNPELPDLRTIAALSLNQIRGCLSNGDLIRIIRAVDYPFAGKERLEFFDRDTLERVVCLVRRWSQQRLHVSGKSAFDPNFADPSHAEEETLTASKSTRASA